MDSFLEEPRSIPKPTPVIQEMETPTVPEVSLMFQNLKKNKTPVPVNFNKPLQSYNAWKLQNPPSNNQEQDSFLLTNPNNKENINGLLQISQEKSFLSRKQVRFQSPVQNIPPISKPLAKKYSENFIRTDSSPKILENQQKRNSHNYSNNVDFQYANSNIKHNYMQNRQIDSSPPITKPFEKLYVSNIPHRELDLSFLEPQKNPCCSQRVSSYTSKPTYNTPIKKNNYADFNSYLPTINKTPMQILPIIQNTHDSTINKTTEETETNDQTKTDESSENNDKPTKTEESSTNNTTNDTVTVNDLLKIIKMQNEQLQILQTQVEKLVKLSEKSEETKNTNSQVVMCKDQQVGTSFKESNDNQKISVGLMTSFEVSFKPPLPKPKKKHKARNLHPVEDGSPNSSFEAAKSYKKPEYVRKSKPNVPQEEKIVPNVWNCRKNNETEYSLGSQESLEIQEPPESPENSIHIDMQEYDTDSSDDECSSDPGWTFYKDMLGQVNHLLENSARPSYKPKKECVDENYSQENYTDTTLEQIKQCTMKRLQNEGFLKNSDDQCPTEVSFALKQILMKYLPDDGLANVVTKNNQEERCKVDKRKPTDVSVAAFKYMQQCNVVTNNPQYYGRKGKSSLKKSSTKNKSNPTSSDPKILDITTLKQQPKFL